MWKTMDADLNIAGIIEHGMGRLKADGSFHKTNGWCIWFLSSFKRTLVVGKLIADKIIGWKIWVHHHPMCWRSVDRSQFFLSQMIVGFLPLDVECVGNDNPSWVAYSMTLPTGCRTFSSTRWSLVICAAWNVQLMQWKWISITVFTGFAILSDKFCQLWRLVRSWTMGKR